MDKGSIPFISTRLKLFSKHLRKQIKINNRITAPQLRVVDDKGENLGVLDTAKALAIAQEKGLDLIEIAPTAKPPVAKIMDYGKFQYQQQKKEKESKKTHTSILRSVRLNIGTSEHDLELKAKQASKFLSKGDRVRIELLLKGRAKYLNRKFIEERLKRILNFLTEDYKLIDEPKKGPRGIAITIEKV